MEANLKRIALGSVIVVIAVLAFLFYSYQQSQREITAGQALTQALVSTDASQRAAACLNVATDFNGTAAGQRALIEGATALFTTGKYADAQAAFQKYLDTYPDSFLSPEAVLGVAASLDALGKTDLAISAYQKAAGLTANANVVVNAKFSLARIYEAQGKLADAAKLFGEVSRTNPNTSLGSEAGLRAMDLRAKLPAIPATTAPATNVPFNLNK